MKSGNLQEEDGAEQSRVQRRTRLDGIRIGPRIHYGPKVLVVCPERSKGYQTRAKSLFEPADDAYYRYKGNEGVRHCMACRWNDAVWSDVGIVDWSGLADFNVVVIYNRRLSELK